jgi:para-nitrobenzyl esterase
MQGSNRDEGLFQLSLRFDARGNPVTAAQYPVLLKEFLGASRVAAVERQYPLSDHAMPLYALVAALSDSGMVTNNRIGLCNLDLANRLASPHIPVFSYEFADRTAPYPTPIYDAPRHLVGAAHTKELSYLFHQTELTPAQRKIADLMIGYWTNFAATGDPNGAGLPAWPTFKPQRPMVMKFEADGAAADTGFRARHKCDFWAEQGFANLSGPFPTPNASGADLR